jgi:hypothetical protein
MFDVGNYLSGVPFSLQSYFLQTIIVQAVSEP